VLESGISADRAIRGEKLQTGDAVRHEPIDRADVGNLQGMAAGIPAYLGAVLAAGVTAARMLSDNLEEPYERELAKGGVLVLVWLRDAGQEPEARALLQEWGGEAVRSYRSDPAIPTGVLSPS
jgi:hypothetical protein